MDMWILLVIMILSGCKPWDPKAAQDLMALAQRNPSSDAQAAVAVDVVRARMGSFGSVLVYTGTTEPFRQAELRAQIEGQLLELGVDVGDTVSLDQTVGRLDDSLWAIQVNQAQAELAVQQSDLARVRAQVDQVRTQVEQAKLALLQAQADALRLQDLQSRGAVSTQTAEQARTQAETAAQALTAAEAQVKTALQSVAAAEGRILVQQAVVAEAEKRRSYALLKSPMTGSVLEKPVEPGTLIRPGDSLLRIGEFSQIKVRVPLSELDRSRVRLGQPVDITLDAFPSLRLTGSVSRISPAADPSSRQIPIEITLPNPEESIGSGLLARVTFSGDKTKQRVIVPQTAVQSRQKDPYVFVIEETQPLEKRTGSVRRQPIILGQSQDGQAEILSGLNAGDRLVVRSSQPLTEGDRVRISIISE
jgi:RND family efflux transporter MFP subunit